MSKHIHIHVGDAKKTKDAYASQLNQLLAALWAEYKKTGDTSCYEDAIDALKDGLRKAERD